MADDLAAVRESICGSRTLGEYPSTDADHVRGLVSLLARMKAAAGVTAPLTGTTVAPTYTAPKSVLEDLRQQTGWRFQSAGDKRYRTIAEHWDQVRLDLLALSDAPAKPATPSTPTKPTTPSTTGWKALPVLTSKAITSEQSSYQSGAPRFADDGMHVAVPARGAGPGAVNPVAAGDPHQRVEAWVAGWTDLSGRQFLRYDFTLLDGFPVDTGTWQAVAQLKNSSTGSPPLEVMVRGGNIVLEWHSKSGAETGREVLGRATTGVRHALVLDVTFASSGQPKVSAWLDGRQVLDGVSHGPTMYPGQSIYAKIGIYRDSAVGRAAEVVFHGLAKGSTLASVTA